MTIYRIGVAFPIDSKVCGMIFIPDSRYNATVILCYVSDRFLQRYFSRLEQLIGILLQQILTFMQNYVQKQGFDKKQHLLNMAVLSKPQALVTALQNMWSSICTVHLFVVTAMLRKQLERRNNMLQLFLRRSTKRNKRNQVRKRRFWIRPGRSRI